MSVVGLGKEGRREIVDSLSYEASSGIDEIGERKLDLGLRREQGRMIKGE